MKTKDVVESAGIDRETLRFYETKGLLPKTKRNESGYRIYPSAVVDRLRFIKTSKDAGFTLKEIKELIELKNKKVTCRTGRDVAQQKRKEVLEKMKALREMKKILDCFIDCCNGEGEKGLNRPCHLSFDMITCEFGIKKRSGKRTG